MKQVHSMAPKSYHADRIAKLRLICMVACVTYAKQCASGPTSLQSTKRPEELKLRRGTSLVIY
jgi:hypothetical protein